MGTGYEDSRLKAVLHRGNSAELRGLLASMPADEFRAYAYEALGDACTHGWAGRARVLLEAGASPNRWGGESLLEHAVCYRKNVNIARLLMEFGVVVHTVDRWERSLLYRATIWGNCRALELLLRHGAAIDGQTSWGETALMAASELGKGKQVRTLLSHGANHALRDLRGWTALLSAVRYGRSRAVQTLLEAGADVHVQDLRGRDLLLFAFCRWRLKQEQQRAYVLRLLLSHGGNATLRARHGITPLHLAAWLGLKDELAVLLEFTTEVNVVDDEGRTPLHYAARSGQVNVTLLRPYGAGSEDAHAAERADAAACDLLLEYGDPRYERYLGNPQPHLWAALRFLAQRNFGVMLMRIRNVGINAIRGDGSETAPAPSLRGKESVACLLLERGADAHAVDANGWTPLKLALACGNEPVARLLRE